MNYNECVTELLKTDGALAAAVVDYSSGMLLAGGGTSSVDLEIAAAGNTEVCSGLIQQDTFLREY